MTLDLLRFTTLVLTHPLSFFVSSALKEKRVSFNFVNADSSYVYLSTSLTHFFLSEMTTKFNKDMYAKMRSKKDEPLSNLGKKTVRVTGTGSASIPLSIVPSIASETTRTASPTVSLEEIPTPGSKRPRVVGKGKEKTDTRPSTIWDDESLAVERAHEVVTSADLKALSDLSLNDVASRHVHKLVQVRVLPSSSFHSFFFFFFYFIYFFFFIDDFIISSRYWERVSISLLSTSLKGPR